MADKPDPKAIIAAYNEQHPGGRQYRLLRLSKFHPTCHIVQIQDDFDGPALCGVWVLRKFSVEPEAGEIKLCSRCTRSWPGLALS